MRDRRPGDSYASTGHGSTRQNPVSPVDERRQGQSAGAIRASRPSTARTNRMIVSVRLSTEARAARLAGEPVTVGLPFPRALVHDVRTLALTAGGVRVPCQARVLDRWSDGSVRWALLDFRVPPSDAEVHLQLEPDAPQEPHAEPMPAKVFERGASVAGGRVNVEILPDGEVRFRVASPEPFECVGRFRLTGQDGRDWPVRVTRVLCEESGPLRTCILIGAESGPAADPPLLLSARLHVFAGIPIVRVQAVLRNPAPARHAGGFWDLGDPASRYLEDFSFVMALPDHPWQAMCSPEPSLAPRLCGLPLKVYQDSSGGDQWQSFNHVNRDGTIPVRFRGYSFTTGTEEATGLRATPVVTLRAGGRVVSAAQRYFWQRFPKALEATRTMLRVGLLAGEFADVHELQGGEQVTEEFVLAFGDDGDADATLEWVRDPVQASAPADWYCRAEAMPHLVPASADPHAEYLALVNAAIEGDEAFAVKRERIDEYGWRHFGDLYADHETVGHEGPRPLISHYNNQYDAIAGFACQFFRTADRRWLTAMAELARHVIDIDVYHTTGDKAAYSQGLFWHTAHHTDADRATHRTYPRSAAPSSGGPSPEHNYNTGLMLHYFLTGDPAAREAAIGLADWVIAMDDGARTPLRWLARGPTGFASATGSRTYHGPGRAPGNSIVALMNACRLTGDARYLWKAEALMRRCAHPRQDLDALTLLDAERRWYYTVFLQALGRYLDFKAERGQLDEAHAYARETLLHYARWMAVHEYPYLEKPEILEFPTETWAAQDMRKCEVFWYAARYAGGAGRERFLERAEFFFEASVSTLGRMPTRVFTRPQVLMLTNGYLHASREREHPALAGAEWTLDRPRRFVSQRTSAVRAAAVVAVVAAALAGLATALL